MSFPAHWQLLPFQDAFTDATGGNPKIQQREYLKAGALPVIDQGQQPIAGFVNDDMLKCLAPLPCLLFGDHTKVFKYVAHPFALGADGVKVLVPKVEIDLRFAYHYLRDIKLPEDAGYSRHFKFLKRTEFPLPPLPEQQRIAAILDKADALRRKRQQALQLTEQFLRSTFLDMFGDPVANPKGWPTATLEQLIKVKSGEFLPAKEMEETGGFAVYGGNGINGRHASYMFEEPVIVIGRVGVYCGVIHVTEPKSWVTDNALYVAQADDRLTLSYLEWALRLANLNQYASQAAQPLISAGRIYGVAICVPDVRSQRRFTEVVVQHGAFVNRVRNACRKGDDLFNSLVQRAFRGEL